MNKKLNFWYGNDDFQNSTINISKAAEAVLSLIGNSKYTSRAKILQKSGVRKHSASNAIKELLNNESVVRTGKGRRGSPYLYSVAEK